MIMKKILCLLAFILSSSVSAFAESGTKIMALVGDDVITYNDVLKRYDVAIITNNLQITTDQEKQILVTQILHSLINEKIFAQEAKKLKIQVTDEEINNVIHGIETQQNISHGNFENFLKSKNISKTDALVQITNGIVWEKMLERVIAPQVQVSTAELNEYIESKYLNDFDVSLYLVTDVVSKINKFALTNIHTKIKNCTIAKQLPLIDGIKLSYIQKKVKDLPSALHTRIVNMNVGQKSPIFTNKRNNEFFILCNKSSGLTNEQIHQIKSTILDRKINLQADYYMKNLSKKTFIEIYGK